MDFHKLQFNDNSCSIQKYIDNRLANIDFLTIINYSNPSVAPAAYEMPQKAQPTLAAVERSFPMLKKLLCGDRNVEEENVKKYMMTMYMMVYFNKR